jgi:hypothetical protein
MDATGSAKNKNDLKRRYDENAKKREYNIHCTFNENHKAI